MPRPLRVLLIEDNPDDAELMLLELCRANFDPAWRRVETAEQMRAALEEGGWEVALSDYSLPGFGAADALAMLRRAEAGVPFFVVSGTIGEEAAVAMMRAGASDYLFKGNLVRLGPAVERELREAENRRARQRAEQAAFLLASVVRSSEDVIISQSLDGLVTSWNPAAERLYGWSAAEAIGRHISFLIPAERVEERADVLTRLRRDQRVAPFESVRLHKDGTRIDVSLTISLVRDAEGRPVGFSKIARDVRDRIRARQEAARQAEALQHSEERHRTLIDTIPHAVWTTRPDGITDHMNRRGAERLGLPAEAAHGWGWLDLLHPDDACRARLAWEAAVRDGTHYQIEYRVRQAGGDYRWTLAQAVPLSGPGGEVERWIGTWTDVDEQRRAAEAVRGSEARFRALVEKSYDGVVLLDEGGTVQYASPSAGRIGGRAPKEYLGRKVHEFKHPDDAPAQAARLAELARCPGGSQACEDRFLHADGSWRWVESTLTNLLADPAVGAIVVNFRDVTERKAAENGLRQARAAAERGLAQLRAVFSSMTDGVIIADAAGNLLEWNQAALQLHGYASPKEARKPLRAFTDAYELSRPGEPPLPLCQWPLARVLQGETLADDELRVRGLDTGLEKVISYGGAPVLGPDGRVELAVLTLHDVTARRRAEAALRLRDRAIQAVAQGIVITDPNQPDNPIIYASPGFEALTGYSREDVLGRNSRFLQGKGTDPDAVAGVKGAVRDGKPCTAEMLNYRKDGTPFWNELSISPVRDEQGRLTHFVGVQADVTQRRQLEEQYRQAQKMEAIGQLAGGVAHDFNNLLTVISGFAELLYARIVDNGLRGYAEQIQGAARRATSLTQQLLAFSRRQVVAPRLLDLNEAVAATEKMLRRLLGEDVLVTTELAANLAPILMDSGQLDQVLMNLAVNARDAMPRGGRLTLRTEAIDIDEVSGRVNPQARPGRYVVLEVRDTGCGMSAETLLHIFEPFFTTKGLGEGTGLGLATVYGIVQQARGFIDVESAPEKGTAFRVHFPQASTRNPRPSERGRTPVPQGKETVLVVEDDHGVRALARLALENNGYRVLDTARGTEALAVAETLAGPIHLLVTDVVMPDMNGRLLAEQLRARYPAMKLLFISGYTDDMVVRHGVLSAEVEFLQKPFTADSLARKVRQVLDGNAGKFNQPYGHPF